MTSSQKHLLMKSSLGKIKPISGYEKDASISHNQRNNIQSRSMFAQQHNLKLKLQRMSIERREKIQKSKDKELYKFECEHRERRSKSSENRFRLSERSRS